MAKQKVGGVYIIRHKHSAAFYIGSSVDLAYRKLQHWQTIRSGKRGSPNLRALANATGNNADDFTFSPLLVCSDDLRTFYENRALDLFYGAPGCLNAAASGNVPDQATREKMREAGRRKIFSAAHCAAISAALKGRRRQPMTPAARAKLSAGRTGRKFGPRPPETRAKISAANKGHLPWCTGLRHSAETRAKMRIAQGGGRAYWTGKKMSPEHRAKMRAAHLARHERRRRDSDGG